MNASTTLQQSIREVNTKKNLERQINDLNKQLTYLNARKEKHQAEMAAANVAINSHFKGGLSSLFGSKKTDDELNQARHDAYTASINYETIENQIRDVTNQLAEAKEKLKKLQFADKHYENALDDYSRSYYSGKIGNGQEVLDMNTRIAKYDTQIASIKDTIACCTQAISCADEAYNSLGTAKKAAARKFFGNADKQIDEAQKKLEALQVATRRMKSSLLMLDEELAAQDSYSSKLQKFSDYFFDDVFLVSSESGFNIEFAIRKVESIRWTLDEISGKLGETLGMTTNKQTFLKKQYETMAIDHMI